jgi:hypothetical protein
VVDLDELAPRRRMPWPALVVAVAAAAVIVITVATIPPDRSPASIDPTTLPPVVLASGEDVEFVGRDGLGGQTLDISAEVEDGVVTGELRFSDPGGEVVVGVECADTATDGVVILGGTVTESTDDEISGLAALFIREGDPDSVAVWLDGGENESCSDLLLFRHDVLDDDSAFVDVEAGSDIVTG